MLWSSRKSRRYPLVLCGLFVLAGCGFQPLYNQPSADGDGARYNVQSDLETINIKPIKDRIGQQLRNLLLTRLNPSGEPANPAYALRITLSESVQHLGIRKTSFATRANLLITATYSLGHAADPSADANLAETLANGSVSATSSYDISTYEFTTLTARKDARKRAVREIADDLRTRLAVFFVQHRKRN